MSGDGAGIASVRQLPSEVAKTVVRHDEPFARLLAETAAEADAAALAGMSSSDA